LCGKGEEAMVNQNSGGVKLKKELKCIEKSIKVVKRNWGGSLENMRRRGQASNQIVDSGRRNKLKIMIKFNYFWYPFLLSVIFSKEKNVKRILFSL
jgi:hypothetical protein